MAELKWENHLYKGVGWCFSNASGWVKTGDVWGLKQPGTVRSSGPCKRQVIGTGISVWEYWPSESFPNNENKTNIKLHIVWINEKPCLSEGWEKKQTKTMYPL